MRNQNAVSEPQHETLHKVKGHKHLFQFKSSWWNAAYIVTDVGKEMVSPFWASAAVARGVATMLQGP